jgi:hypothetical protein
LVALKTLWSIFRSGYEADSPGGCVSIIPKYIIHIIMDTRLFILWVLSIPIRITSSHNIFARLTCYICLCFMSFNGKHHERDLVEGTKRFCDLNGKVLWVAVAFRGRSDALMAPILTYMGSPHKS